MSLMDHVGPYARRGATVKRGSFAASTNTGLSFQFPTSERGAQKFYQRSIAAYPGGASGLQAGVEAQDLKALKYWLSVTAVNQTFTFNWPIAKAKMLLAQLQGFQPSSWALTKYHLGKEQEAIKELIALAIKYGPPTDIEGGEQWKRFVMSLLESEAAKQAAFEASWWGVLWGTTAESAQDLRDLGSELAKFSTALGIGMGVGFVWVIAMQTGTLRAIKRK